MQNFRILRKYAPPGTEMEHFIAEIWSEVLEVPVDKIGVNDNFFILGGDSLLLTQVLNRINETYSLDLTISTLFLSPDIRNLSRLIEERERKRENGVYFPVLDRKKMLPVSISQEGLWFLHELSGRNTAVYNSPAALHISGHLNIEALHKAFNAIISRHEILRTSFKRARNTTDVVQVITDNLYIDLPVVKVELEEVNNHILEHSNHVFDLSCGPLIRTCLLQLTEQNHILLINLHQIVTDGWSTGILIKELRTLYASFCKGGHDTLPPLPLQYADYAYWQRQWLLQNDQKRQLTYWCQKLDGIPQRLDFRRDNMRPQGECFRGSSMCFLLSRSLVDRLSTLALKEGVTKFMVLLAVFKILLVRHTNQKEIIVGTPVANRSRPVLEKLIGTFVNIIVLRDYVDEGRTFRDFLKQVRQTSLEAFENQAIPFEQLVKVINPIRNDSHSPLFQVMFVLQNTPAGEMEMEDLDVDWIEQSSELSRYDLTLELSEKKDCMVGKLEYSTDLFTSSFIKQMISHYEILLEGVVNEPGRKISCLPLLSKAEYVRILQGVGNINTEIHHAVKVS